MWIIFFFQHYDSMQQRVYFHQAKYFNEVECTPPPHHTPPYPPPIREQPRKGPTWIGLKKLSSFGNKITKKMKFPIKDFFIKCDQIRSLLRIWSHLLKKFLMGNFIFCAVYAKSLNFWIDFLNFWTGRVL